MHRLLLTELLVAGCLLSTTEGYVSVGARPAVLHAARRAAHPLANAPSGTPAPLGNSDVAELISFDIDIEGDAAEETEAVEVLDQSTPSLDSLHDDAATDAADLSEGADDADASLSPPLDPTRPLISSFADVDSGTVELLAKKGITNFTPIQAESFALLRSGNDLLGRSRTGTGKTLAFSLPLVLNIAAEVEGGGGRERGRAPRMIVLAPTRELARQVAETVANCAMPHGLRVTLFHGGVPYPPQQRALREGVDVLVGTPGRIIDHIKEKTLDLSNIGYVVLDEADEMLNMGFKESPSYIYIQNIYDL